MSPWLILSFVALYFAALVIISKITAAKAGNSEYFIGNKQSPWYAVAFGMIGDSLSGVTYISVPGAVGTAKFSYLQLVLGYVIGYWIIGAILLPLYYRMNLTSIYTYLEKRFGIASQRTGAFFFIVSRLLGAAGRLWLAVSVLQIFVFDAMGVPFMLSVAIIIGLMLLYTYRGGIKTLVWTDAFQSAFLLLGVVLSIVAIVSALDISYSQMVSEIIHSNYTQVFFFDPMPKSFFAKQFLAGVFIAVTMTGLDQNMMQKNLSCRSLPEAQKNVYWFSLIVLVVNVLFLSLGALLYIYAEAKGIAMPAKSDALFPTLALNHLGTFAAMVFIIGLTAATFNSADSVLTTLTTSLYIDFFALDKSKESEQKKIVKRHAIHIGFAILLLLVIVLFQVLNNQAVIDTILMLAGYTYGPLLGMFAFGIFSKRKVKDTLVPVLCVIAPAISYALSYWVNTMKPEYLNGYQIGNELILVNGLITYLGLWILSENKLKNDYSKQKKLDRN
ncbi:MAG: sodium:solute symporter [Bacteroidetes bacterium 37-13]|nr:MAG: sodium:solute symporter [Bacteroidetes bacterium 37-13]